ncbi:MAG: hypothetical protein IJP29_01695 [Lachnospiraceae bacterium]|nr:hypothetical protein [Lachnospiraceae bacterium]
MKSIILVGAFIEAVELCEKCGYHIVGITDPYLKGDFMSYPIIGTDDELILKKEQYGQNSLVLVPDSPVVREKLFFKYKESGFKFETIISPLASISKSATIGEGCVIADHCNVSSAVILGRGVRLNVCANIMHECVVDDFVTIAPNAVVLGRCKLASRSYIGANATILPEHSVGELAVVGAASVVTKDVATEMVVAGNPARGLVNE